MGKELEFLLDYINAGISEPSLDEVIVALQGLQKVQQESDSTRAAFDKLYESGVQK